MTACARAISNFEFTLQPAPASPIIPYERRELGKYYVQWDLDNIRQVQENLDNKRELILLEYA
jgi:hypothetical protein